jgi:predicted permease
VPKPINPDDISSWNLLPVARLNAMVSLDEGRREIDELWRDFLEDFGPRLGDGGLGSDAVTVMTTLHQRIVGDSRSALLVLFAGAGIVLLIACANLANLFLIRAWARRREMAVRRSLGATSRQLMRPILVESTLLALLGGTVGFGVAYWGLAIVKGVAPSQIPRIALVEIDWLVALFALAVTALVALVCGLIPAVRCREVGLVEVVNLGPRGTTAGTSGRYNEAFAIAQLALSLVLLIAAALLVQRFRNLTATDPGFRSQNLLMGQIPSVPVTRYPSNVQVRAFYERLLDGVRATPGVQAAELSQVVPFSGGGGGAPFTVEGFEPKAAEAAKVSCWRAVTPGHFAAIGSPVIRGRPFVAADTETSLPVAIVDEKLARMHSPDRNVVGKRVRVGQGPWMTIVGVVASMKNRRLNEESMPYPYQPFAQRIRREMMLVVRSTVDPAALVPSIRRHMASLDPEQPIFSIMTLDEAVGRAVAPARTTNVLLGLFAAAAFGLAIIGLYAVMSLNVSGRLNEFGIRLALGGHARSVRWLVVGRSLKLVGIPLAGGLIGASAATRALQGLLFGVQPTDPAIFISVSAFLAGIAMAAADVPAPRATKIDPLALLRYQ